MKTKQEILEDLIKEGEEAIKPYNLKLPRVIWNYRARTKAGCYRFTTDRKTGLVIDCWIELTPIYYVEFGYERVKRTLMHEIAHHIDRVKHGGKGHGYTFKKICQELGGTMNTGFAKGEFSDTATTEYRPRKKLPYKYLYGCPCGNEWKRKKKFSIYKRYSCPDCKQELYLKRRLA